MNLDIVRYLASMALAVAGAVSLIVQFRHPEHKRVTRSGAWMMAAIIFSGTLLVVVQIISDVSDGNRRRNDEAARELDRSRLQAMQDQLGRSALPLNTIQIGYSFQIRENEASIHDDSGHFFGPSVEPSRNNLLPEFRAYLRRVRRTLATNKRKGTISPSDIIICNGSRSFPDPVKEPHLSDVVRRAVFEIQLFKQPINVRVHPWFNGDSNSGTAQPDLQLRVYQPLPTASGRCPYCGCIWIPLDFASISVKTHYEINATDLVTTGKISSVSDLAGAQLFVMPRRDGRIRLAIRQFSLKPGSFEERISSL